MRIAELLERFGGIGGGRKRTLVANEKVAFGQVFMSVESSSSTPTKKRIAKRAVFDSAAPTIPFRADAKRADQRTLGPSSMPTFPTGTSPYDFRTPAGGLEWDDDGPPTEKTSAPVDLEETVLMTRDILAEHTLPMGTTTSSFMPDWLDKDVSTKRDEARQTLPPQWAPPRMPKWLISTAPSALWGLPFKRDVC